VNLAFLRPLYRYPGPFATVYLDASADTQDARRQRELRWRAVDEALANAGTDRPTREALGEAYQVHQGSGRHGLALFATAGRLLLEAPLPEPPAQPEVYWTFVPAVSPLVTALGEQVHWLRVLVDRTGADIEVRAGGLPADHHAPGEPRMAEPNATEPNATEPSMAVGSSTAVEPSTAPPDRARKVSGSERYPINKVRRGGWSSPRFDRSTRTSWRRNAKQVAETVGEMADQSGVDVVVLAGDVRGRQLVRDQLAETVASRVVETDAGSRAGGADDTALDLVTTEAIRQQADAWRGDALDAYRVGRSHQMAVNGRAGVRLALGRGQVATLLMAPQTALPEELIGLAASTDAELVVVHRDEEDLADGVGAVLRWAEAGPAPTAAA
jgi:hypothetical protein